MPLETHIEADQTLPVSEVKRTVMQPIVGSSYLMCATCGRVNTSDARYCDWCGASVRNNTNYITKNCLHIYSHKTLMFYSLVKLVALLTSGRLGSVRVAANLLSVH